MEEVYTVQVQSRSVDVTVNHCKSVLQQSNVNSTMGLQWTIGHMEKLYKLHWIYLQCNEDGAQYVDLMFTLIKIF